MEIYLRCNDDLEKDYTFKIEKDDTFNSKTMKVFSYEDGLSSFMVLRPSIFYKNQPIGLYKSTHPGFLTENGCLIFHYDAGKSDYLEELDLDKKIIDQLWPGQLVVPKWEKSWPMIYFYLLVIVFWLYTDLPDVISPSPGICLTNQLSKLAIVLANRLEYFSVAEKLSEEIQVNFSSVTAQWIYFALHILKVLIITSILYTGAVNPLTLNPLTIYRNRCASLKNDIKLKEILKNIGWAGARKATYDDYKDTYYQYIIEKSGGMVSAYKNGLLKKAMAPGVALSSGEGFQTVLSERFGASTFETMHNKRQFILSEEYFIQLEKDLNENLKKLEGNIPKINIEIRKFRRYGLFESSEKLIELVRERKEILLESSSSKLEDIEKKKN